MSEPIAARPSPRIPRLLRRWEAPLAVLGGGLLGSAARALLVSAFSDAPETFPTTTLAINVTGSLALGLYLSRRQGAVAPRWSLRFWAIGVLGSFTTFSAFSIEVVQLVDAQRSAIAAVYVLSSILAGLAAAVLGSRLGAFRR